MRTLILLTCLIPLMAAAPSQADEDDHDEAREAVEHGAIVPLAEVLARPALKGLGELVRVRLDRGDGHWTYRLRFVDEGGHIRDREVDAARGRETQGRR